MTGRIRNCGDGFCLLLIDSRFNPGTKAWKLVRADALDQQREKLGVKKV